MTRSLRLAAIAALLVLLSLAAACGGGGGGEDKAPATPNAPEAASTSEAAGEADLEIRIEGDFAAAVMTRRRPRRPRRMRPLPRRCPKRRARPTSS